MLKSTRSETLHVLSFVHAGFPHVLEFLQTSRDDLANTLAYAAEDRVMRQAQGGVQVLDDLIAALTYHDRLRSKKT